MAIMVKGTRAASDAPFKWPTRSLKALTSLSFFTRHTDKIDKKFTVVLLRLFFKIFWVRESSVNNPLKTLLVRPLCTIDRNYSRYF